MKRALRLPLCLLLTVSLIGSCALAGFVPVREARSFSDVPASHWSCSYVQQCDRLGLMGGTGEDRFSPSGTLQAAEAVTVCVRLRDLYDGGDGTISQEGEHWYDPAVERALELGILTEGQFDRYDRAATRAELAGLLARALPEEEYAPINQIASLPDVTAATPYYQDILTLYNAGILTGSDGYGTFNPAQSITRAEVSAILCRLALPETRVSLTLEEKPVQAPQPADTTIRMTGRKLYVSGAGLYGVVDIGGKFYIPLNVLTDRNALSGIFSSWKNVDGSYTVDFHISSSAEVHALSYWSAPPAGHVMGKADATPAAASINGTTYPGAVYTLGGKFPMVSLDALGVTPSGTDFLLNNVPAFTVVTEGDLAGGPLPGLRKGTDRETVRAIHDYLVNTLTYNPLYSAPYGTSQATLESVAAAMDQAYETYAFENNVTLSTKYGICQNYAELFQTMCIRSGIPCVMVTGMANGDSHAWNQVYVDGQWLYVDCTFDDPVSRTPVLNHTYCLVGPDAMVRSHYWEGDDYPMPDEYDPAWASLDPNNITSADMFRKCLVAQLVQKKTDIRLRTTVSGAYGGMGCIYAYPEAMGWWYISGGYNSSTGTYDYHVEY